MYVCTSKFIGFGGKILPTWCCYGVQNSAQKIYTFNNFHDLFLPSHLFKDILEYINSSKVKLRYYEKTTQFTKKI